MNNPAEAGTGQPVVSVCLVTHRRGPLLTAFLQSLRHQSGPPPFEVLVYADGDTRIVDDVRGAFPDAVVETSSGRLPGAARNRLIEQARGSLLLFLDDDVIAKPDLLRHLTEIADAHPDVGVFGGPNLTPPGSTPFQFVQGAVLASMVAAGPARKRYGIHPAGPATEASLCLCNLVVRRKLAVPFAQDMVCAEENEALLKLRLSGVTMRTEPGLAVFHERRGTFRQFLGQMYKYGYGRGQLIARSPRSLRLVHLLPSLMVMYALLLPLLVVWSVLAAVPLGLYLLALSAAAVKVSLSTGGSRPPRDALRRGFSAATLIAGLHACYGAGVVRGAKPWRVGRSPSAIPVLAGAADLGSSTPA